MYQKKKKKSLTPSDLTIMTVTKKAEKKSANIPVGLCPEDFHQTTEPAGKWGPDSSSLLWFSSWPSTCRSPARTPSRRSLQTRQQKATCGHRD